MGFRYNTSMTQFTASLLGIGGTRPVDPVAAKRRGKRAETRASGRSVIDWIPAYRTVGPPTPPATHLEAPPTVRYGRPTDVLTFIDRHLPPTVTRPIPTVRRGRPSDVLAYITEILTPASPAVKVTVSDAPFVPVPSVPSDADLRADLTVAYDTYSAQIRRHPRDKEGVAARILIRLNRIADELVRRGASVDDIHRHVNPRRNVR